MLRGWIGPSRYLSKRKQRKLLVDAGVDERVIYLGENGWPAFVKALRPGTNDKAAVADLRVFGSRRGLLAAAKPWRLEALSLSWPRPEPLSTCQR
jgi:hypothetical protein